MKTVHGNTYFKAPTSEQPCEPMELDSVCCFRNTVGSDIEAGNEPDSDFTEKDNEKVDFILVYDAKPGRKSPKKGIFDEEGRSRIRTIFEENLIEKGLELEKEIINCLTFVKIHAPVPLLKRYCEIMKLKMPLKETNEEKRRLLDDFNLILGVKNMCKKVIRYCVTIDPRKNYHEETTLFAEYSIDKSYLFDEESPNFFTPTVRILVVDFILNRTVWTEDDDDLHSVGVQTLIDNDVYKAAYPLHDGAYKEEGTLRNSLRRDWADLSKWIRLQPMNDIKNYLGVKCAFYFAWLGFYTQLLIPASALGIAVFIYGFFTLSSDPVSSVVCNEGSNFTMCPMCNKYCDYWNLSQTCTSTKITYLFDNNFTVVFAFLMSVWATLFLELWKRHSAVLSHCWGLSDYTSRSEHPRPQFLATLAGSKKMKKNVETNQLEPVLSFWFYKLPTVVFSYTVVILFILIVFAVVFGIVLYRMWMMNVKNIVEGSSFNLGRQYTSILTSVIAGFLNLISIMILSAVYDKVANYLTTLELPRTQTEFDNSLSIKMYIFQFVNYYASIMYIAFFKGKFVGYPKKYNTILGFRQEECTGGGCITELSIQLAIIMIGQQIFNSILEIVVPAGWNWFNHYSLRKKLSQKEFVEMVSNKRWAEDYRLLEWSKEGLFSEYLEVAIQFGFVTLFASAFPMAPLFALLNNVLELRLDAQKILRYYRRPVPHQVPNIGVWYRIFDIIGKMAVIFNAAIIAFSSSFIPLFIYHFHNDGRESVLEFATSTFNVSDFPTDVAPIQPSSSPHQCLYYGYRDNMNLADERKEYKHSSLYWKILTARLLFMFIFQNAVFIVKTGAQWLIPDVPQKLTERMRKEARTVTELLIKRETELALNNAGHETRRKRSSKVSDAELFIQNA